MATNNFFNESLYLAVNLEVAKLIAEGKYTSGLDYYTKVGQFAGDGETEGFFTGTKGNHVIVGFGKDQDLIEISLDAKVEGDTLVITPETLGKGEIDTKGW